MSRQRNHENDILTAHPDARGHRASVPEANEAATREELSAIRGRLHKATPGPWELKNYSIVRDSHGFPAIQDLWVADVDANGDDFPLITHAPDDLSRLLNAVEGVLKVHRPEPARYFGSDLNPDREYDCAGCGEGRAYPCAAAEAIAVALEGER